MRRLFPLLAIAAFLEARLAPSAAGTTYLVNPQGSGDFPTLEGALAAVQDGDVIELADGTYQRSFPESFDFLGKAITVRSQSGVPENCLIHFESYACDQAGFIFQSGETEFSTLQNISISSGWGKNVCTSSEKCFGGAGVVVAGGASPKLINLLLFETPVGVRVCNSSPQVIDCRFLRNGAGLHAFGNSTPFAVASCLFEQNEIAVYCQGGLGTITGSVLSKSADFGSVTNTRVGMMLRQGSQVEMESCLIQENAGGVTVLESQHTIRNCLISGNASSRDDEAGVFVGPGSDVTIERTTISGNRNGGGVEARSTVTIEHSVIWGNCKFMTPEVHEVNAAAGSMVTFQCSLVDTSGVGGPGLISWIGTNIYLDPLFIDPRDCVFDAPTSDGDYCLSKNSPGRNVPGCGTLGAIFDPCLISVESTSWGKIKALYR
ncbi:MAG TPA: right-handed parallel beta-helix repeat-containing protein [bacterium]|nr:right-handed parallel beta-helix repeat-containing protein [bacterium]